jgi:SH3-like domain-containing protein
MKSTGILLLLVAVLLVAVPLGAQSGGSFARGSTLYVAVKSAALKSSAGFFASNRALMNRGDAVTVLQEKGKWVEVRPADNVSLSGWIAQASLTAKRITNAGREFSNTEVAMAGKGFTEEVEKKYQTLGEIDYTFIDQMEARKVPEGELLKFLTEGRLARGE